MQKDLQTSEVSEENTSALNKYPDTFRNISVDDCIKDFHSRVGEWHTQATLKNSPLSKSIIIDLFSSVSEVLTNE
jgi:hypothetical protein